MPERNDPPAGAEAGTDPPSTAEDVRFVLVGPKAAGNVGAAARAIKNFGFRDLRVVAPRCELWDLEAVRMAMEARDVLEGIRVHEDLDRALDGAGQVVGLTRRTGKHRHPHLALEGWLHRHARLHAPVAFVFGREDHGLSDDELDRCTYLAHLPTHEAYGSLNLSQAVLLTAYELRRHLQGRGVEDVDPVRPAPHEAREAMYEHLETALAAIGFLEGDSHVTMMRRIRRMLGRADLDAGEVRILRGIARQVLWLARRAGLPVPERDPNRSLRHDR